MVPPVLHHHAKDVRSELHPGTRNPHFLAVAQLHGYAFAIRRIRNNLRIVEHGAAAAVLPAHSARLARCTHKRHAVEQGPRHLNRGAQRQQPQQLPAGLPHVRGKSVQLQQRQPHSALQAPRVLGVGVQDNVVLRAPPPLQQRVSGTCAVASGGIIIQPKLRLSLLSIVRQLRFVSRLFGALARGLQLGLHVVGVRPHVRAELHLTPLRKQPHSQRQPRQAVVKHHPQICLLLEQRLAFVAHMLHQPHALVVRERLQLLVKVQRRAVASRRQQLRDRVTRQRLRRDDQRAALIRHGQKLEAPGKPLFVRVINQKNVARRREEAPQSRQHEVWRGR